MSFARNAITKALTLALAGMVGAGMTGAALAAGSTSQDAGSAMSADTNATGTMSATGSQDLSNGTTGSSDLSNGAASTAGNPSALDHGNGANANGTPVEVYRRQTTIYLVPDQAGSAATAGSAGSSANGTAAADQHVDKLVHNDVENPNSVIGPAGGLRSNDATTSSRADLNANGNAGAGTASTNADTTSAGTANSSAGSATAPAEDNRLPANREDTHPGKGSMQNGGMSGPSGTSSTSSTGTDSTSSSSSMGSSAHP